MTYPCGKKSSPLYDTQTGQYFSPTSVSESEYNREIGDRLQKIKELQVSIARKDAEEKKLLAEAAEYAAKEKQAGENAIRLRYLAHQAGEKAGSIKSVGTTSW